MTSAWLISILYGVDGDDDRGASVSSDGSAPYLTE